MDKIKKDICHDIRLLKGNLDILLEYLQSEGESGGCEPEHDELMSVYGVSRILKESMVTGNDEIIHFLRNRITASNNTQHS